MVIGCTGNYRKSEYFEIVKYINNFLSKNDIKCVVSSDLYNTENLDKNLVKNLEIIEFSELEKLSDIILCIGGVGTFLSTARRLENVDIPLLGIHIGGLGFLAEVSKDNINHSLQYIINKNYSVIAESTDPTFQFAKMLIKNVSVANKKKTLEKARELAANIHY